MSEDGFLDTNRGFGREVRCWEEVPRSSTIQNHHDLGRPVEPNIPAVKNGPVFLVDPPRNFVPFHVPHLGNKTDETLAHLSCEGLPGRHKGFLEHRKRPIGLTLPDNALISVIHSTDDDLLILGSRHQHLQTSVTDQSGTTKSYNKRQIMSISRFSLNMQSRNFFYNCDYSFWSN